MSNNIDSKKFQDQLDKLRDTIPINQCKNIKINIGGITSEVLACRPNEKTISLHGLGEKTRIRGNMAIEDREHNGNQTY